MADYMGWEEYLFVAPETTWGQTPGSPDYFLCPFFTYGPRYKSEKRSPDPYVGVRQRIAGKTVRGRVEGQIVMPVVGRKVLASPVSILQYFFDAALSAPSGNALDSFLAEFVQGSTTKRRHNGLRINQMTLAGSPENGVQLTLDVIGSAETTSFSAQSVPNDLNQDDAMDGDFEECAFQLGGGAAKLNDFSFTVNNNLEARYQGQRALQKLKAGQRVTTFQATLDKEDETYDDLQRNVGAINEIAAQLVIKALQADGATYTQLTIDLARCNFTDNPESGAKNETKVEQISFDVLKPDTADNDVKYAFADV